MAKLLFTKNKFINAILIFILLLTALFLINPLRKIITYKTTNVFEDRPLGHYVQDYHKSDEFRINDLKPEDLNVQEFVYEKVRYKKYENVINWTLKTDEFFEGHTDVLGICRYHLYVYPNDEVNSSIEIDHQGGACDFWENIKQGDTVSVIGEVVTSKRIWAEASKQSKYATDYVIEVRPMIVEHQGKIYIDNSLPAALIKNLLEQI